MAARPSGNNVSVSTVEKEVAPPFPSLQTHSKQKREKGEGEYKNNQIYFILFFQKGELERRPAANPSPPPPAARIRRGVGKYIYFAELAKMIVNHFWGAKRILLLGA